MNILAIIPARGGSKGLPGKNIRTLCGKPLICYAIDSARSLVPDSDICVTTDDASIIEVVENYGLAVPFVRPSELASDTATTNDVLIHALDFYKGQGKSYDAIVLLQPTTPLRENKHIKEAVELFRPDIDMVMGVRSSHAAAVLCNENTQGFLDITLSDNATRRQDVPTYYEVNGAVYVINTKSLVVKGLPNFDKRVKYVMPPENSIDIDTLLDFEMAEYVLSKGLVKLDNHCCPVKTKWA